MQAVALAFVCGDKLTCKEEASDREFDREGHEHRRRIVDEQQCGESDTEVRMPIDV
jgi:hypothetical protein